MITRAAIVLIAWGAWLGVATAAQAPFHPHVIEYALLGGASAATLLCGLLLWVVDAHERDRRVRAIPGGSIATATLVSGLALALIGAGFGLWLILIGAGVAALGAAGLVREERARRRALERGARR
jgi:O-antigen/teichoic acid export membrane protein